MKITVAPRKPRNPLATLARRRRAGSHRAGGTRLRQQAQRAMKRELELMKHIP
jgi:hypothetical protein